MPPAINEWDEVKKLAADFQRAQATSSLQRLSDRNYIDVINKLRDLSLLEVIYSLDGKEYITHEHLKREISDELIVAGGRIHLTEVSSILNVDISHVESRANELIQESGGTICSVLGQLISQAYKEKLIDEIDQTLRDSGSSSIGEISKQYDLPADFVASVLESNVTPNSPIKWSTDGVIFTQSFINRYKAKIRAILLASVVPITNSNLTSSPHSVPSKILSSIFDDAEFISTLPGSIQAKGSNISYVPSIYSRNQRAYVSSFYNDNNYLEYETLKSLGISDPKNFITNRIPDAIHLINVAVSPSLEASIQEAVTSESLQDLTILLPSVLSGGDIEKLYNLVSDKKSTKLLCDTVVVPVTIIESISKTLSAQMDEQAKKHYEEGTLAVYFTPKVDQKEKDRELDDKSSNVSRKEERRRKAAAGSGSGSAKQISGGNQGREIKTKAVKRKPKTGNKHQSKFDSDSDDVDGSEVSRESNTGKIQFMTLKELTCTIEKLNSELQETHQDLPKEIARLILPELNSKYAEVARKVWSEHISSAGNSKKIHADLSSTLTSIYTRIHFSIRALESLNEDEDNELKNQLSKHLQKTLCTDAFNSLISFVLPEENVNLATPEARNKAINRLNSDSSVQTLFTKLAGHLTASELDASFLESLESAAIAAADILLKPIDKKKEKIYLSENKYNLLSQMNEESDASLVLHAAVLLIAQHVTGSAIHASGKFVPQIINFLNGKIPAEVSHTLTMMADLVISLFKQSKSEDQSEQGDSIKDQLDQLVPELKSTIEKQFK